MIFTVRVGSFVFSGNTVTDPPAAKGFFCQLMPTVARVKGGRSWRFASFSPDVRMIEVCSTIVPGGVVCATACWDSPTSTSAATAYLIGLFPSDYSFTHTFVSSV